MVKISHNSHSVLTLKYVGDMSNLRFLQLVYEINHKSRIQKKIRETHNALNQCYYSRGRQPYLLALC